MSERICKGCGQIISNGHFLREFHGDVCKHRYYAEVGKPHVKKKKKVTYTLDMKYAGVELEVRKMFRLVDKGQWTKAQLIEELVKRIENEKN